MFNDSHVPNGINVIGYVSSNLSLGITAREFIRLFLAKGIRVAIRDIDFKRSSDARVLEFDSFCIPQGAPLPYDINMFFLAVGDLSKFLLNPSSEIFRSGRLNVGLMWYELTSLPRHHAEALACLDVLACGSGYVRSIFDTNVSGPMTVSCKHPIGIPDGVVADRSKFGLPDDIVLYACSFDPHHDVERKNPFGAIAAFKQAFPNGNEAVGLVVKVNNADVKVGAYDPKALVNELEEIAIRDRRIVIVARSLAYEDVLSLYASCDVLVSLHRAEGLGLVPLEGMRLAKPVVATAWSGNMSYMSHTNSCLVGYDLVPYSGIGADGPHRLRGKVRWAEARIGEAADWMRALANDESLRSVVGSRAQHDAMVYQEEAERADFLNELFCIYNELRVLPTRNRDRWRDTGNLRKYCDQVRYSGSGGLFRCLHDLAKRHFLWRFRTQ